MWNPDKKELARHRKHLRGRRRKLLLKLISPLPTAPFRALPDFLIIGAAKSATTTLYAYLEQSPHVAWTNETHGWSTSPASSFWSRSRMTCTAIHSGQSPSSRSS